MNIFNKSKKVSFYKTNDPSQRKHHMYSAGILPYQIVNKKVYFLLGKDNNGFWSDFGGKCDPRDENNIKETASREFYEESFGSVLGLQSIKNMLQNSKNYKLINSESMGGITYYMFIMRVPMRTETTRDRFNKTLEYMKYINADFQYREKVDINWISLDTLLLCVKSDEKNAMRLGWPLKKVFKKTLLLCKKEIYELKHTT